MNAPKLRFKEFTDDWKSDKISNLTTYVDYRGKTPVKTETGIFLITAKNVKKGYIDYNCSKEYVEASQYNAIMHRGLPKVGDVLVTTEAPCGNVAQIDNANVALAQRIIKYRGNDLINNDFLKYELLSDYFQTELKRVASGGTVYGVKGSTLHQMSINYCSKEEQTKIAQFLSLLDKKIELQKRKIKALKLFKKGLSPMIFNSINIISEKKLGNICSIKTGKLDANAMTTNGKYRFYTCAKNYYYTDNYAFDNEALLISGNGAYVGYIHYYKGKFNAYQRTYVLDSFLENIQYVKVYLEEFLPKRISLEKKEGNTPYIVLSTLYDMKIKLTDSKTEDKVINLFFYVNSKIKQESEKFNKYNELKKGLIQSMFI